MIINILSISEPEWDKLPRITINTPSINLQE